jgi:hypothetical protein
LDEELDDELDDAPLLDLLPDDESELLSDLPELARESVR